MTPRNTYLNELIDFGGEIVTRGEAIAEMQREGHPQGCIDRWLQGQEFAARHERTSAQFKLSQPRKRTRKLAR